MKLEEIIRYSKLYDISPNWLITGSDNTRNIVLDNIHIWKLGNAGNLPDGEVDPVNSKNDIEYFPRLSIIPDKSKFIDVIGPQIKGFARGGWKLICQDSYASIDKFYMHQLCVISDIDGRLYLRIIRGMDKPGQIELETPLGETEYRSDMIKASLVGLILPPAGVDAGLKIMQDLSIGLKDAVEAAQNSRDGQPEFSQSYSVPFSFDWQAFRLLNGD